MIMRTKASFIITLIADPATVNEVAGKVEVVKNGVSFYFNDWDELKTRILDNLRNNPNAIFLNGKRKNGEIDTLEE